MSLGRDWEETGSVAGKWGWIGYWKGAGKGVRKTGPARGLERCLDGAGKWAGKGAWKGGCKRRWKKG